MNARDGAGDGTAAQVVSGDPAAPAGVRAAARSRALVSQTSGAAPGYVQANLVAVPEAAAGDLAAFVERNAQACPLIEVVPPGEEPLSAPGARLWSDVPRYRVFRPGAAPREAVDVEDQWRPDLVAFLLGCSFTFDHLLMEAGLPVRHVEAGTNVPMYVTNRSCQPAGPFSAQLVVSMRPLPANLVEKAVELTAKLPHVHGAPAHVGDPEGLGIRSLDQPDFGDPVEVGRGEVSVFWACGVTPQLAVESSGVELAITHAPGHMFVTDIEVAVLPALDLPFRRHLR